jgi:iron complex outermembrane receptor protein
VVLWSLALSVAHTEEPASSTTDALLDEVTVTARKRSENLQDTPISISAHSGEAIAARGITRIDEITRFTPNLVFQNNPGFNGSNSVGAVFIRGVGQKDFVPTTEPGVGIYVDGVYMARSIGALLDLVDVERIEVLRGPQGTLFGRNTIGGAISVITRKPDAGFSVGASATYGDGDRIDFIGKVNVPVTDRLFMKLSGARMTRDGYVRQLGTNQDLGDRDTLTGRLALRWLPASSLAIDLSLDGTRERQEGVPFVLRNIDFRSNIFNPGGLPLLLPGSAPMAGFYVVDPPADVPVDNFALLSNYIVTLLAQAGNCLGLGSPTYDPAGDPGNPLCYGPRYLSRGNTNNGTFRSQSDDDVWGSTLSAELGLAEGLLLRSITAYRSLESAYAREDDMSPLVIGHLNGSMKHHQFSQELQLLGTNFGDRLNWIVGAYYFSEGAVSPDIVDFTPVKLQSGGTVNNKSYAAFAQGTYELTDALSVTLGLRYTADQKKFLPQQLIIEGRGTGLPPGFPVLPLIEVEVTPSKATPLVNLAYRLSDGFMVFTNYTEGFKSGGFTQRVFPPLPETPVFEPEIVRASEIGFKADLFGNRFRLNGSIYYTKYDDIQVQVFRGVGPELGNAGEAEIKGLELELSGSPADGWFVESGIGYTDPEFTRLGANVTELTLDSKFERISDWMLSAAVQKEISLGGGGSLTPRVDWAYRSRFFNDPRNTPTIGQPGYGLVNLNVAWRSADGHYTLTAGAKNLLDKDYVEVGGWNPNIGPQYVVPNRGLEWYLTLGADF